MVDFTNIDAAISALNNGFSTLTRAYRALRDGDTSARLTSQQTLLEAEDAILSAKGDILHLTQENTRLARENNTLTQQMYELREQKGELREQIKTLRAKLRWRKRLTLHRISDGFYVYLDQAAENVFKQGPWWCQQCLDNDRRVVLQKAGEPGSFDLYRCPSCKAGGLIATDRAMDTPRALSNFDPFR